MKLTIKLNIEESQNIDFETNEYKLRVFCYQEILEFLEDWVDYCDSAVKLRNHIKKIFDIMQGDKVIESETSVSRPAEIQASSGTRDVPTTDSGPSTTATQTKVVQTQNFVDVRECKDYSEKSYKLIGYDNREVYIAKQHVISINPIEGGGTRVMVPSYSAWVITKLEWK